MCLITDSRKNVHKLDVDQTICEFFLKANEDFKKYKSECVEYDIECMKQEYLMKLTNVTVFLNTRIYPVKWYCNNTKCTNTIKRVSLHEGICSKCKQIYNIDEIEKKKGFAGIYGM